MTDAAFTVTVDAAKATATVELCLPEAGNKLTVEQVTELGRAIRSAGARRDVKAVLIRAQGDNFCIGRGASAGAPPKTALEIRTRVAEPILGFYADVRATEVPVVAVVQGPALGFGCAMVGICDLAIAASETARFAMPEMDHHLPPTLAMSTVIGKVPPKALLNLVLTRGQIDAAVALSIGLVSQVAPRAGLDAAAAATVARFTDRDRGAVCAVKEYLVNAMTLDAASSQRLAANTIAVILASQ